MKTKWGPCDRIARFLHLDAIARHMPRGYVKSLPVSAWDYRLARAVLPTLPKKKEAGMQTRKGMAPRGSIWLIFQLS